MLRIGILTSGGDCQALNAAMRGVVKGITSKRNDVEIYGFKDGYKGLIYANFEMLTAKDFSGILTVGGTILGTSRQPFKLMRVPDANGLDKVKAMKHTYHKLNLNCLVVLGGNGTHKTANLLREEGLNVITLPKTIDNDLWGTDMTFGFQSAVDIATNTIDCIHTTATSHSRVFIVEVMGHKVGWVTLHAGIAGGADIILLPAPGTVPGITMEYVRSLVVCAHSLGKMTLTAIGTSQEGADTDTIKEIALMCKMTGTDLHHLGDAGYGGMALPENILEYGKVIRGIRHTYHRMAVSIRR